MSSPDFVTMIVKSDISERDLTLLKRMAEGLESETLRSCLRLKRLNPQVRTTIEQALQQKSSGKTP